jgi:peptidoglycan/LPS O-acetylase OafA/YrhL
MSVTGTAGIQPAFRGDINGLRAWAVVAVILYHFGVPGFGGGFVGVDVFFVISGFLMTGIVVKGLEQGDFSLLNFYMARAKRIVPGLAWLSAVLLVMGWFVLLPAEYKTLATHAIYSLSFLSNIEFWQEAGYFDLASHQKWLLHTWSLSVEWQFYMILPLALWATWLVKPGRAAQRWALAILFAVSLLLSVPLTRADPVAAFFLLHTRAWEMLAGGLVAVFAHPQALSAGYRRCLEVGGLALILVSVTIFEGDASWPGWRALLPVLAAAMVLVANRASPFTGNKVAQWLGDRSYSLYLWHWPVYVGLAYIELSYNPMGIVGGLLLTLALASFSYAFVENKLRHRLGRGRFRHSAAFLAAMVLVVVVPGALVWVKHGVAGRFPAQVELVAAEAGNYNPRRKSCHMDQGATSPSCTYGGTKWKVILAGDSHGDSVVAGISQADPAGQPGVVQWTYSSCPLIPGIKNTPADLATHKSTFNCTKFSEWVAGRLDALPANIPVVIVGRYAAAALGRNEDHLKVDTPRVYFSSIYAQTTPQFLEEFSGNLVETACHFAKKRTVYLMRPIPEMGVNVPKSMSRRIHFGMHSEISIPMDAYHRRNDWVWAAQDKARDTCGIKILDPLPYLCHDGRCYGTKEGKPLYIDDNHLSGAGNALLVPMFAEVFEAL